MLEKEDAYYMAHKAEFHEKYLNKWLVIYGEELIGTYDTIKDAIQTALLYFDGKDFLLRRPADDDTVIEIGPIINDGSEDATGIMEITSGECKVFTYA